MVKTRAQREQGFVTPSPKTVEQVQSRKGTTQKRKDATQKSMSGTAVKSRRQVTEITDTPRNTRNAKTSRHKSPDKSSKEKRLKSDQKSPAKKAQGVDKEELNEEEDVEGCHGNLKNDDIDDAIPQRAEKTSRRSGRKQRNGLGVEEADVKAPVVEDDETMAIEPEEDEEEEEHEEEEEENEEEEEEEEEVEEEVEEEDCESDTLDTNDASEHRKQQTREEASKTSNVVEPDADSDDDAPQDISFSTSRQEALDSISQALQQTKRTEERAKEKRRNRDKLLKLQKERKKISLEHSRLPEDFLSEVARIPDGQLPEPSIAAPTPKRTRQEQHHKVFDSDGEMDFDEEGDDYIPLSSDGAQVVEGFEVHAISRQERAPPPKSDVALDFLQQQLYGAKIKRESVIKHKARLLKRQGKPSLVFHNPKEKKRRRKHQGSNRPTEASQ